MSFDAVRTTLAGKVLAVLTAFDPTVLSQFENQESVDMNGATHFVDVRVQFKSGEKISMETGSPTRYHGELQTYVVCKAGAGTKRAFKIAEALARGLEDQKVGTVQLVTPRPMSARPQGDWYSIPLMTNFYTDTT